MCTISYEVEMLSETSPPMHVQLLRLLVIKMNKVLLVSTLFLIALLGTGTTASM